MRNLILMKGIPGSGKSTWIKKNNLEEYTLSFDKLRVASGSQKYTSKDLPTFPPNLKPYQINYFLETLKDRFRSGAFTIIDNTNLVESSYQDLIKISKAYDYNLYYKSFEVTPEEAYNRILKRGTNYVPLGTLHKMNEEKESLKIPTIFKKIDELEDLSDIKVYTKTHRFSSDKNIYFIGDIHGCLEPLNKFLDLHYKPEDFFIFGGDYIDRGPDSKGVINLLKSLYYSYNNVIFLEGNHERWLRYYANDLIDEIASSEFKEHTLKQFLEAPVLKKGSLKNFCGALKPFVDITIEDKRILFSHGGTNSSKGGNETYPLKSSNSYISGSGGYSDLVEIYNEGSVDYDVIVHGHRNLYDHKVSTSPDGITTYYNLEGGIEKGGELRFLKVKGSLFEMGSIQSNYNMDEDISRVVGDMRNNKDLINERETSYYGISSFNFNKDAFYSKQWKKVVCKARGLFIDTLNNVVVGRGYEKFFNYGENDLTSKEYISSKMPFNIYSKENGFLGIIYYNNQRGELSFNTKSGDLSDYSKLFEKTFNHLIKKDAQVSRKLSELLRDRNMSLTVEVIDYTNDPHLTNYSSKVGICILDLIENSLEFKYLPYEDLCELTNFLLDIPGFSIKKFLGSVSSMEEFHFYSKSLRKDTSEGVVLRNETSGFMFKVKTKAYQVKKALREYHYSKNRTSLFRILKKIMGHRELITSEYISILKMVDSVENFSDLNLKTLDEEILLLL